MPVAVNRERFVAVAKNFAWKKGIERGMMLFKGIWLVGAKTGSLWFCFAGSLAGRQKSEVSDSWQRSKWNPTNSNSSGS